MIGYDKWPINHNLYLALTLEEMIGTLACDRSKRRINCTLHGAGISWNSLANGLPYLDLDPGAGLSWLDAPAAHTELDFTTEQFSMVMWVNVDDLTQHRYLIVRGVANTDGWLFYIQDTGRLGFSTCQAAATQSSFSYADDIVVGNWYLVGISRSGTSVRLYKNGQDRTDAPDTHVNPLTAARELHIGIQDDETTNPLDAQIWLPRIWGARALTQLEHDWIFQHERTWLGV